MLRPKVVVAQENFAHVAATLLQQPFQASSRPPLEVFRLAQTVGPEIEVLEVGRELACIRYKQHPTVITIQHIHTRIIVGCSENSPSASRSSPSPSSPALHVLMCISSRLFAPPRLRESAMIWQPATPRRLCEISRFVKLGRKNSCKRCDISQF
jgi:hypothetical protein